jgi:hypothetical protein
VNKFCNGNGYTKIKFNYSQLNDNQHFILKKDDNPIQNLPFSAINLSKFNFIYIINYFINKISL